MTNKQKLRRAAAIAGLKIAAAMLWFEIGAAYAQNSTSAEIGTVDTEVALELLPADVAALQTTLLRLRLYRQAPTGELDSFTRGAIASWQNNAGYAPTTYLGPEQFAALRDAAPPPPTLDDARLEIGAAASEAALELTKGEIKTVQDRLCALKFLRGPISGDFDASTRSALMAWQQTEHVASSGYLGPLQFERLLAAPPRTPDGVLGVPCGALDVSTPPSRAFRTHKAQFGVVAPGLHLFGRFGVDDIRGLGAKFH